MSVDYKDNTDILIKVPKEMVKKIDIMASLRYENRSEFVRSTLREAIERLEEKKGCSVLELKKK